LPSSASPPSSSPAATTTKNGVRVEFSPRGMRATLWHLTGLTAASPGCPRPALGTEPGCQTTAIGEPAEPVAPLIGVGAKM
jgi:hypothetical protein